MRFTFSISTSSEAAERKLIRWWPRIAAFALLAQAIGLVATTVWRAKAGTLEPDLIRESLLAFLLALVLSLVALAVQERPLIVLHLRRFGLHASSRHFERALRSSFLFTPYRVLSFDDATLKPVADVLDRRHVRIALLVAPALAAGTLLVLFGLISGDWTRPFGSGLAVGAALAACYLIVIPLYLGTAFVAYTMGADARLGIATDVALGRLIRSVERSGGWTARFRILPRLVVIAVSGEDGGPWRTAVTELVSRVHAVIIDVSVPTDNVLWEIRQVRDGPARSRAIYCGDREVVKRWGAPDTEATLLERQNAVASLLQDERVLLYDTGSRRTAATFGRQLLAALDDVGGSATWVRGRWLRRLLWSCAACGTVLLCVPGPLARVAGLGLACIALPVLTDAAQVYETWARSPRRCSWGLSLAGITAGTGITIGALTSDGWVRSIGAAVGLAVLGAARGWLPVGKRSVTAEPDRPEASEEASSVAMSRVVAQDGSGDYTTIGAAIDGAPPGSRILVRPGAYRECVTISTEVDIVGEGRCEDIVLMAVDGSAVSVEAEGGRIENLTIRQFAGKEKFAVRIGAGRLEVSRCDIRSMSLACIGVFGEARARILQNRLHDGAQGGVFAFAQASIVVDGNDISGCRLSGIEIAGTADAQVRRNVVHQCGGSGVWVREKAVALVEENKLHGNEGAGLRASGKSRVRARRNEVWGGRDAGLLIEGTSGGLFTENEVFGHRRCNVDISDSASPVLQRNIIHGGMASGLMIYQEGGGLIEENEIHSNAFAGVSIRDQATPRVRRNRIFAGSQYGVHVHGEASCVVEDNDIFDNRLSGILVNGGRAVLRRNVVARNLEYGIRVADPGGALLDSNDVANNRKGEQEIDNPNDLRITNLGTHAPLASVAPLAVSMNADPSVATSTTAVPLNSGAVAADETATRNAPPSAAEPPQGDAGRARSSPPLPPTGPEA